jgi:hypothetical protein
MNNKDKTSADFGRTAEKSGVKPSIIEDVWQNYDSVFKDAVSMFKDKSLDFFGLPKDITIAEPLKTETKEIVVKSEFADLTFRLSNGKGLHLESEAALSEDDLFRFCHYHIDLVRAYRVDFTTVIFVKEPHGQESLEYEMLTFKPVVVNCAGYDADAILAKLKEQAAKGEALNELELIYLPLFRSARYSPAELLTESIRLISGAKMADNAKLKISALALVLSNKLVDAGKLEEIWRELKMMRIKVLEYGMQQSFQEGMEKGKKEIAQINRLFVKEKKSPDEIAKELDISLARVRTALTELGYDFD